MTDPIELRLCRDRRGRTPFRDWLESFSDRKTVARIEARLARVRSGNVGDSRELGGGIAELRLFFGAGYRIYYSWIGESAILLLCGGGKDGQSGDVERARTLYREFIQSE